MFKKKTGGKRVNCFLYIVHRAPEKMSKMFAKKVSKEGAKGHREKRKGRFWEVFLGRDFWEMPDLSHLRSSRNYFWER